MIIITKELQEHFALVSPLASTAGHVEFQSIATLTVIA
jgi:hypothetical protein